MKRIGTICTAFHWDPPPSRASTCYSGYRDQNNTPQNKINPERIDCTLFAACIAATIRICFSVNCHTPYAGYRRQGRFKLRAKDRLPPESDSTHVELLFPHCESSHRTAEHDPVLQTNNTTGNSSGGIEKRRSTLSAPPSPDEIAPATAPIPRRLRIQQHLSDASAGARRPAPHGIAIHHRVVTVEFGFDGDRSFGGPSTRNASACDGSPLATAGRIAFVAGCAKAPPGCTGIRITFGIPKIPPPPKLISAALATTCFPFVFHLGTIS